MKSTTFLIAVLATLASATPVQPNLVPRQHAPTGASVTGFTVTRNATHINYAATVEITPGHAPVTYTHSTAGTTLPTSSGFYSSADPNQLFRWNRIPVPAPGQYRIVVTDAHTPGSSFNFDFLSPVSNWAGAGGVVYTGPADFLLD
ncbi:hypothetical protein OQA88_12036 [Cercophora sp. LCS_1]